MSLLTNGDFVNWTADDPDDWTTAFTPSEIAASNEVAESDSSGVKTLGGEHCMMLSGPAQDASISQAVLVVGSSFLAVIDITFVSDGGVDVYFGTNLVATFTTVGTKEVSGVAVGTTTFMLQTIDTASVVMANVTVTNISVGGGLRDRYHGGYRSRTRNT